MGADELPLNAGDLSGLRHGPPDQDADFLNVREREEKFAAPGIYRGSAIHMIEVLLILAHGVGQPLGYASSLADPLCPSALLPAYFAQDAQPPDGSAGVQCDIEWQPAEMRMLLEHIRALFELLEFDSELAAVFHLDEWISVDCGESAYGDAVFFEHIRGS
jgi:hypothetical protein